MKLSVCMMVKNEEQMLPRALESVYGKVDEIIVVDTGSTDKTIQIAKQYGAKVYHHKWRHDFSLHRNQSIQYATGDWLIILDADEEVIWDVPILEFRKFLEHIDEQIYFVSVVGGRSGAEIGDRVSSLSIRVEDIQNGTMQMTCNGLRIFRRGSVKYDGIVHNQPICDGLGSLCHHLHIRHYGYGLSRKKMERKFKRTRNLLFRRLEKDPKDYDAYFFLSQSYGQRGDSANAAKFGEQYLQYKDRIDEKDFHGSIYFTLIVAYQCLGNHERAKELIDLGLKHYPNHPDITFAQSNYAEQTKDWKLLSESAMNYCIGYDNCITDPQRMGGRFYFTLKDEMVALQLYRKMIADFVRGYEAWEMLKPRIMANQSIPDVVMRALRSNLPKLNMQALLNGVPGFEDINPFVIAGSSNTDPIRNDQPCLRIRDASRKEAA